MSRRRPVTTLVPAAILVAALAAGAGDVGAAASKSSGEGQAFMLLKTLVETPGVSTREQGVRDRIRGLLPAWARPETDARGNLLVTAGPDKGGASILFIAHMDETGYLVTAVRDDGLLDAKPVGGFFPSLYQGQVVIVHTAKGDRGGVVPPRPGYLEPPPSAGPGTAAAPERAGTAEAVRIETGASSRKAAEAEGFAPGDPVTVPKAFQRLYGSFGSGRAVDDRAGCTALILAMRALDPKTLKNRVTFAFSVEEETGLDGAQAMTGTIRPDLAVAVDTFVSSDSPLERPAFALAVLGKGPVIRAIDNSNITDPAILDKALGIARQAKLPIQYGLTRGGNDGSVFPPFGTPDLALSWPTVHSHSAVEVINEQDLEGLGTLVRLVAERW